MENIKNPQHAVSNMSSMIDYLKQQKEFNVYRREQLLLDMRTVANNEIANIAIALKTAFSS